MFGSWVVQRANNQSFKTFQNSDKAKRLAILAESRFTKAEKRAHLQPVEEAMKARFDGYKATAAGHRAKVLADHAASRPRAVLTSAASSDPARAFALIQLYGAAGPKDKQTFAEAIAAAGDPCAAYAMGRAMALDTTATDEERLAITATVARVTAAAARQADAEWFAFEKEAAQLDFQGWECDPVKNADRILELANAALVLPSEEPGFHMLSESEQNDLLRLAGVPDETPLGGV